MIGENYQSLAVCIPRVTHGMLLLLFVFLKNINFFPSKCRFGGQGAFRALSHDYTHWYSDRVDELLR